MKLNPSPPILVVWLKEEKDKVTGWRTGFVLDSHVLENVKVTTSTDHEDLKLAMLRKRRKVELKRMALKSTQFKIFRCC